MSAVFQPFGLKPVYHPSGLDRAEQFIGTNSFNGNTFSAPTAASQTFYQYTPVKINSSGALAVADASGSSGKVYGVFNGVEYTTAEGRRTVAKYISLVSLAAATQVSFWIFRDPGLVYEAQIYGSATSAAIGTEYNFNAAATVPTSTVASGIAIGNGGAGFSTTALNATAVGTGVQGQVRVIGLGREIAFPSNSTNTWGDAYTIVQVQICNNTFSAPSVSV
jgi:hypothetical protein